MIIFSQRSGISFLFFFFLKLLIKFLILSFSSSSSRSWLLLLFSHLIKLHTIFFSFRKNWFFIWCRPTCQMPLVVLKKTPGGNVSSRERKQFFNATSLLPMH
uniref:Uncharacterized protein n=1 Tax=Panstrongylus lignarius TaxID=156445 RepID=A0A224Y1E9_9HEMI